MMEDRPHDRAARRQVMRPSFLTFWPEIRDATASSMKKMECYVRLVEVAAMQL